MYPVEKGGSSASIDHDPRAGPCAGARGQVALVDGKCQVAGRVDVQHGRTLLRVTEAGDEERRTDVHLADEHPDLARGLEGIERGGQLIGPAGQAQIPEAVHVGHLGLDRALASSRSHRRQPDQRRERELRPDIGERRVAGRQMSGRWREDVPTVKGRAYDWPPEVRIRQLTCLDRSTQRVGSRQQESVVRPDEDVASFRAKSDRPAVGADARVDDADMDADGQVGEGCAEDERSVANRVLPDRVADVDDLRGRADR